MPVEEFAGLRKRVQSLLFRNPHLLFRFLLVEKHAEILGLHSNESIFELSPLSSIDFEYATVKIRPLLIVIGLILTTKY